MKTSVLVGAVLCVVGLIALIYQGFSYTAREKIIDIGPIVASAEKTRNVAVSPIIGAVALIGGIALMVNGSRK